MNEETRQRIESFITSKQQADPPKQELVLASGRLVMSEVGNVASAVPLDRSVPAGTYSTDICYLPSQALKELEGSPTLGIDGFIVHFADRPVASWQAVKTIKEESPVDIGDLIDVVVFDAEASALVQERAPLVLEDCYSDGFGGCAKGAGFVIYVGEVALEHDFYWGLDKDDQPVKLVGMFRYRGR